VQSTGLAAAEEGFWAALELRVSANDLAEPESTELRNSFSADQTSTFPNYRAWSTAARLYATAVAGLLDFAVRNFAKLKWQNGRLVASDKRTATDLAAVQEALADAEHRYNATGSVALHGRYQTVKYALSALRELEKTMPRRDGT
jgi:hypothetical protein